MSHRCLPLAIRSVRRAAPAELRHRQLQAARPVGHVAGRAEPDGSLRRPPDVAHPAPHRAGSFDQGDARRCPRFGQE